MPKKLASAKMNNSRKSPKNKEKNDINAETESEIFKNRMKIDLLNILFLC